MDTIHLQPVESSNIAAIGYDDEEQALFIEFNSGSTYKYIDVPFAMYEAFMDADSKGRFFHSNIRQGGYAYERLS
jgi:hypothetical protein